MCPTSRPDAYERHAKVCTPDNPGGPLGPNKHAKPGPTGSAAGGGGGTGARPMSAMRGGGGGGGGAGGTPPRREGQRPRAYVCYLCGQQFGSQSLTIHVPQCYEKWLKVRVACGNHGRSISGAALLWARSAWVSVGCGDSSSMMLPPTSLPYVVVSRKAGPLAMGAILPAPSFPSPPYGRGGVFSYHGHVDPSTHVMLTPRLRPPSCPRSGAPPLPRPPSWTSRCPRGRRRSTSSTPRCSDTTTGSASCPARTAAAP